MRPQSSRGPGIHLAAGLRWPSGRVAAHLRWATHLWGVPALVLGLVVALAQSGCSGGGTPSAPPSAPVSQAAVAKPAAPAAPAAPAVPARPYVYEARDRRDPFRPLIASRVVETRTQPKTGLAALEVNELKLAGIVWEQRGFFALVEAPNGAGYVLRVNDRVGEGARVTKITPEGVTFEMKATTPLPQAPPRLVELRLRKEE